MTKVIRLTIILHDFLQPTHSPTNAPNKIQLITAIKLLHVSALGAIFTELQNKRV